MYRWKAGKGQIEIVLNLENQIRCVYCNKLLCYGYGVEIRIKCPRCGKINTKQHNIKKALEHLIKMHNVKMVSPSKDGNS